MSPPRWMVALWAVVIGVLTVSAVDRTNFKTCNQSGFCKRHRAVPEGGPSPYMALLSTLAVTPQSASLHIRQTEADVSLTLTLKSYSSGVTRLIIDELTPVSPRYRVPEGDVILDGQTERTWEVKSKDGNSVTLARGITQVIIQSKPFRLDYLVDGALTLTLNSRGLMKFEHLRIRIGGDTEEGVKNGETTPHEDDEFSDEETEDENGENDTPPSDVDAGPEAGGEPIPPVPKEEADEETAPAQQVEEPDMWEETFKTHTDSKPHGPSSVGLDVSFIGYQHVYGIPEHADSFALKSTRGDTGGDPYRLYNLDVFEYEINNPMALYGSVPMMLAHSARSSVGVFWNNPSETWVDVASSIADKSTFSRLLEIVQSSSDSEVPQMNTHWFSESGVLDISLLPGPTPAAVYKQYASLTGTTALPPLFSLAYHQSRWNYNDEADVQQINENYDDHDIPMDVVWLDIEHTDGKRYFTWDSSKFPDSLRMIEKLTSKGRKLVTIVDPHIKRDSNYKIHKEAGEQDLYIKDKSGSEYDGWCWPGSSSYLDFTDPSVRSYWASKFLLSEYQGTTEDVYTWNDMNEPSVFNGPEITMHKDAVHKGGWEHRDIHNLYGMYQQRATAEGQVLRSGGKLRPFVLSRAFYAGSQRWGAIWTGDNTGDWSHLKISVPMILSLSVTGITFSGADIGGFFRNPDTELVTRWYQAAAYQPFMRAHSHLDTRRREPWLLPDDHKAAIQKVVRARYALLPYWYTLFYRAEQGELPPARPLWMEFPSEESVFAEEEAYMVGSALLVRPVLDQGTTGVTISLPGGATTSWYDVDTYEGHVGGASLYVATPLDKIPVLQRGGTVIPRKNRARRSSALMGRDPYTLIVALDQSGSARGELYIDDFQSFEYKQGAFALQEYSYCTGLLTSKRLNGSSTFTTPSTVERVVVVGLESTPRAVTLTDYTGSVSSLQFSHHGNTLTVRNPAVNTGSDWQIQLS